jgi:adenosylcobinamide-GDP ribazoletransferase
VSVTGDAARLATGTLTALRVPPPTSVAPPVPGRAMALAPVVGLVPGLAAWASMVVGDRIGLGTTAIAVLAVAVLALTTRGLHLDGLADTADALAASYRPERSLEVMRRGDTGPAGVAAVVLVLLLQAALLAQAVTGPAYDAEAGLVYGGDPLRTGLTVVLAAVAARVTVAAACVAGVPSARPDGLGAMVAGSVARPLLAVTVALTAAGCAGLAVLAGRPWWAGPLAVLLALLVCALLVRRALSRFGGITGDVLGACVEGGTVAALVVLAVA